MLEQMDRVAAEEDLRALTVSKTDKPGDLAQSLRDRMEGYSAWWERPPSTLEELKKLAGK